MKEFFKRHKIYILTGSLIALIGSFSYWGIFCSVKQIREYANKAQEKLIDLEINQKKFAKIPQMQKTLEELDESEKKLLGVMEEDQEVDFIKKIEILAEETQNKIDLKIVEGEQKDGSKTKKSDESKIKLPNNDYISLQANIIGNYSNIYSFIKKLENFEYYVNVISINSIVEEDKSIKMVNNDNPFISLGGSVRSPISSEADPKFLLKTQINFIAYTAKK